jgi:hypothetical protein
MTSGTREEKLNSTLAHCEQLYDRLLQIVPNLAAPDFGSLPEDKKRLAATAVYHPRRPEGG